MIYLEKFVDSLKFLVRFNKEYRRSNPDFIEIEQTLRELSHPANKEVYEQMRVVIEKLAFEYAEKIPQEHLVNRCHSVSHGFGEAFRNSELGEAFSMNVTVGNVYYKGNNIYGVTKQKLKQVINQGYQLESELPVHVWLTLDDMSVFDLTIIPTLIEKGLINPSEIEKSILIWHENMESDFHYEPLLVDNDFMHRVDKVLGVF